MNNNKLLHLLRKRGKELKVAPQILLQTYMMERFLERLSKSEYCNNFVLKGGLLIASMLGLDTRSTRDIDTTIISQPMELGHIQRIIEDIVSIPMDDQVHFKITKISSIMAEIKYSGFVLVKQSCNTKTDLN